jgi:hypoxanthine phosphoribosyltransferase
MDIRQLFDATTIQEKVTELGRRLGNDLGGADPWIISIVGGSVLFLADLIRAIEQPVRFDFIQVQYSVSASDGDLLEIHYPISLNVEKQNLVILKDVVVSGVIENYLSSQFRQRGARQVQFAGLIDIPDQRKTDFQPDYSLFTTERQGTFVGYGLKHQGRFGNLPFIGIVEHDENEGSRQAR